MSDSLAAYAVGCIGRPRKHRLYSPSSKQARVFQQRNTRAPPRLFVIPQAALCGTARIYIVSEFHVKVAGVIAA